LKDAIRSFLGITDGLPQQCYPWNQITRRAAAEGLAGLCYEVLLKEKFSVPAWVDQFFRFIYFENVARYMRCEKALGALLNSVDQPVIVLKGMALVPRFYCSTGLRGFSDLDVLIRGTERQKFASAMKRLGYCIGESEQQLQNADGVQLDIHTDLFGFGRIQSRKFAVRMSEELPWTKTRQLSIQQSRALCLEPELELLFLCYHMVKHSFLKLIWIVDIAKILSTYKNQFRWDYFIDLAQDSNLNVFGYYGLHFTHEIAPGLVPSERLEQLMTFQPNALQSSMYRAVVQGQKVQQFAELFFISSIQSGAKKMAFIREVVAPAAPVRKQIVRNNAGSQLKIGFYPIRFFQLMRIGLSWLMSLVRHYSFRWNFKFSE